MGVTARRHKNTLHQFVSWSSFCVYCQVAPYADKFIGNDGKLKYSRFGNRKFEIIYTSFFIVILGGNTNNAFQINSTGSILSRIPLDYENDTQKTFDLTVMVADRAGLTDTSQVRITVLDANDNIPQIINLPSPAEFNISDNVPAGWSDYNLVLYYLTYSL